METRDIEIVEIPYEKHGFQLTKKKYKNIPVNEYPNIGDIVQQAESNESDEFEFIQLRDQTAICMDPIRKVIRYFSYDSIRKHPAAIKRAADKAKKEKRMAKIDEKRIKEKAKMERKLARELARKEKEDRKFQREVAKKKKAKKKTISKAVKLKRKKVKPK